MDMQQLVQTLKSSVRQRLKNRQNFSQGYAQHYAHVKETPNPDTFPYSWGECITPIKQRTGAANINENRRWNMQLAIAHISGLVLQPGEIFSFWHQVPQPTIRNGFRSGPMLIRGRLKTDVGGGLCQISTTLFGAFLYANCEILEHHNHSIDAHGSDRFFILGQDAAVVYGYKDLMVRNPHSVPLQLRLHLETNPLSMHVSLWSSTPCPHRVRLTSEVLEPLAHPQLNGMPGWRVETQRWVAAPSTSIESDANDLDWQMNYRFISRYQPFATMPQDTGTLASTSA